MLRTTTRKVRAGVGVLILVGGLLAGVYPPFRSLLTNEFSTIKGKVTGAADSALSPVHPAAVQGSAATSGHPPKAAFDEFKNTYWDAPFAAKKQPTITVQLANPVALRKVIITSGASGDFTAHERPSVIKFAYSNEKSDVITLKDSPTAQQISLANGVGVTSFTLTVVDVYAAQGAKDVALTEAELFGVG